MLELLYLHGNEGVECSSSKILEEKNGREWNEKNLTVSYTSTDVAAISYMLLLFFVVIVVGWDGPGL